MKTTHTAAEYAARLAARYADRLVVLTGTDASSPVEIVGADGRRHGTPFQFADASCSRRRLAGLVAAWVRSDCGVRENRLIIVTSVGGASAFRR